MKYFLSIILLLITNDLDPTRIRKLNQLKEKARVAYEAGNYEDAIKHYKYLLDTMNYESDMARLNLSNAYYQSRDTMNSKSLYQQLTLSEDRKVRSVANQQLGVMANGMQKKEMALEYFKNSLRADPTNEEARYNYELLKKQIEEEKQQQQQQNQDQDQNQDQEKKDQQNQEQQQQNDQQQQNEDQQQQNQDQQNQQNQQQDQEPQDQEQENQDQQQQQQEDQEQENSEEKKGEQEQSEEQKQQEEAKDQEGQEQNPEEKQSELSDEEQKELRDQQIKEMLEKMNLSPEKARMILDAMKANEVQYLQQNKRKPTKKKEKDKPDW